MIELKEEISLPTIFLEKFEWLNTNFESGTIGFECEISDILKIIKITDSNLISEICNSILRALPLWFGIESAIVDYVKDVKLMQTWVTKCFKVLKQI